ncbi:hypothetical protein MC885_008899 [Smutsia gigantea]|nr:hypothetical protein MC885_008899 [Smutsia gigantea]
MLGGRSGDMAPPAHPPQGLFDNFLRLRLRDSSLGTVCTALDWLAFDDMLGRAAHHGQSFQLLRYLPFLPAAFHLLFASSRTPRIVFPSSQQEAQSRTSRMQNLIQTLVSGIAPAARSRAAPQALVLDTLCLLLDILTPKLRPVSTQLYSAREKQQLASLVGTMLAYSLTYRQERTPDGLYVYRLEPNVEELCRFPELPTRKPLTYQAQQLIAHEIEMEKMRRAEALARAVGSPQVDEGPLGNEGPLGGAEEKGPRAPTLCSHKQRLEHILKRVGMEEQVQGQPGGCGCGAPAGQEGLGGHLPPWTDDGGHGVAHRKPVNLTGLPLQPERDFFGRVVIRRAATPSAEDATPEINTAEQRMGTAVGRSDVWFRFKEGVSNAVRRSLYIRDLL